MNDQIKALVTTRNLLEIIRTTQLDLIAMQTKLANYLDNVVELLKKVEKQSHH